MKNTKTCGLFSLLAIVLAVLKMANLIEISWKAIIGIWLLPAAIVLIVVLILTITNIFLKN